MNSKTKSILLILSIFVLAIYWPVTGFDFVTYDDNLYVTNNLHVQHGLSWESVKWALTTEDAGFWHPLTWLSLMVDYDMYGLNAGGFHLTNLMLHLLNTLLLFLVLHKMTGCQWQSGLVAALFAVHPLHVESVAWVAERKDVLSTAFWMLTMGAYAFYAERPTFSRYAVVALFFVIGLLAKPMLVTLPFVLLLFDYWPLRRIQQMDKAVLKQLALEKIPLFLIAFIFGALTIHAESRLGALPSQVDFPLVTRLANAVVSALSYIGNMIWPVDLSFFYPHPGMRPVGQVILSVICLTGITILTVARLRKQPFLFVGWLFYVGTLLPVSGIIQVGGHGMADRYTYIPLIGLFIMVAWGLPEIMDKVFHKGKAMAAAIAVVVLSLLSILCSFQVQVWKNSISLFTHAVHVNSTDGKLQHLLGYALMEQGRFEEGIIHFRKAVQIENDESRFHYNLAVALSRSGRDTDALPSYIKAVQINPGYGEAYEGLGMAYQRLNRYADARDCYKKALAYKDNNLNVYNNLALVLCKMGEYEESENTYRKAIVRWPDHAGLRNNLAMTLASRGQTKESIAQFREAVKLQDDYAHAHYALGRLLYKEGQKEEAKLHLEKAATINPAYKVSGLHNTE